MLNVNKIFIINLLHRPDRKSWMDSQLDKLTLGAEHEFVEAIDGKSLDIETLKNKGIKIFEGWKLPYQFLFKNFSRYYFRDISMAEVACTLSHLKIWDNIIENKIESALVLEDDALFTYPESKQFINYQIDYFKNQGIAWDFIYLGRQALTNNKQEVSPNIVVPGYSWLSHAYIISNKGAEKLSNPLIKNNIIPVDEYLPAMMDAHPREDVKKLFPSTEKLIAYAIYPCMVGQLPSRGKSDIE